MKLCCITGLSGAGSREEEIEGDLGLVIISDFNIIKMRLYVGVNFPLQFWGWLVIPVEARALEKDTWFGSTIMES